MAFMSTHTQDVKSPRMTVTFLTNTPEISEFKENSVMIEIANTLIYLRIEEANALCSLLLAALRDFDKRQIEEEL